MQIVESPNHDSRSDSREIDMLVLHYTGMQDFQSALTRLTDPKARVSTHYLVDEQGEAYRLVPESMRAWHAGVASWGGESDINGCSIGIELVNPGHEFGYRSFPEPQMVGLEMLAIEILARHRIPPQRVLGHADVAPARRRDPGELFDWPRLASSGIGVWPAEFARSPAADDSSVVPGSMGDDVIALQESLGRFGYGIEHTGAYDSQTQNVIVAFQRHFRPSHVDGISDAETRSRLDLLVERYG